MADLDQRVARLEQILERAIAEGRKHPIGRLILGKLGLL